MEYRFIPIEFLLNARTKKRVDEDALVPLRWTKMVLQVSLFEEMLR